MYSTRRKTFTTDWSEVPVMVDPYYVAELLRISVQMVIKHIHQGKLKAVKIGRFWRISRENLMEYCGIPAILPAERKKEAAPYDTIYGTAKIN